MSTAHPESDTKEDYVAQLLQMYHDYRARWDTTDGAKEIQEFLRSREWNIRTAVCLGITTFKGIRPHDPKESRVQEIMAASNLVIAMWQFAAFMSVVDTLKAEGNPIAVYVYDPQIETEMEFEFLRALGVNFGPSVRIFDYITSSSFVFGRALPRNVLYADALHERDPVLYIGNHPAERAQAHLELHKRLGGCAAEEALLHTFATIAEEFHKTRKSMPFPGHETKRTNWKVVLTAGASLPLTNMAICWREGDTTLPLERQEDEERILSQIESELRK